MQTNINTIISHHIIEDVTQLVNHLKDIPNAIPDGSLMTSERFDNTDIKEYISKTYDVTIGQDDNTSQFYVKDNTTLDKLYYDTMTELFFDYLVDNKLESFSNIPSEYWSVSYPLALTLRSRGETVTKFHGLHIWSRYEKGYSLFESPVLNDLTHTAL